MAKPLQYQSRYALRQNTRNLKTPKKLRVLSLYTRNTRNTRNNIDITTLSPVTRPVTVPVTTRNKE